jgi:hypothetical protein
MSYYVRRNLDNSVAALFRVEGNNGAHWDGTRMRWVDDPLAVTAVQWDTDIDRVSATEAFRIQQAVGVPTIDPRDGGRNDR